jgi:hypothetical protein
MTHPEPDSSQEYNPYELFTEELDLDAFELEQPPSEVIPTHSESVDASFITQDEDRLYTDELIRQNEMASRSLFLSVITAAAISVGIGLWYLLSQKQTPPSPPIAPIPVPEQPPVLSPPTFQNPAMPTLPIAPSGSVPTLAPPLSGGVPSNLPNSLPSNLPNNLPNNNLPNNNSGLPAQPSPNAVVPPPPPSAPTVPAN